MAGPNGGYREPNNPAPVSGPGQLSQRTDGGPQQVQADMSGMPYGENAEFNTMQSMAPMSASPSARSPRASARSAKSAGGGMSATPLFAPTQRPDEPVTAGAPFGPGDGPSAPQMTGRINYSSLYSRMAMENPNDDTLAMLALAQRLGY
jgi:hypothetical protein